MEFLIILAVLALVALFVARPLWRPGGDQAGEVKDVAELEAARDAKYREIRDAELDLRTGKLSQSDFEAIDGTLRAEAIEILRQLDAARERVTGSAPERLPTARRRKLLRPRRQAASPHRPSTPRCSGRPWSRSAGAMIGCSGSPRQ